MKNKGFSLVELIVVIAIMAILVGVAVPVYSSYIEKAQKSKDEQMVDEIKHAIEIAAVGDSWATKLTPGVVGTIVITDQGTTVTDEDTAALLLKAMTDTFGSGYNTMKLSYDGWTGTLNAGNISYITSSSYYGNVPQLMGDVQDLTSALMNFVDTNKGDSDVLGENFVAWLGQQEEIDLEDSQAIANAATLYVAKNMTEISGSENQAAKEKMMTLWTTNSIGNLMAASVEDVSILTLVAAEYARAEAIVNYLNCEAARAAFVNNSVSGTNVDQVLASIGVIMSEVNAHLGSYEGKTCSCTASKMAEYFNAADGQESQAKKDANAYFVLMQQVNSSEDVLLSNIGDSDLYSGDTLTAYVNNYVAAADVMQGAEDGDVVIVVSMNADGTLNLNVYPLDYTK